MLILSMPFRTFAAFFHSWALLKYAFCCQEVPELLGLPSSALNGSAAWIIMTGTTLSVRGYNNLLDKVVPLANASRSANLIPYMQVCVDAFTTKGGMYWPHLLAEP